jgi:hypothetical protein
MSPLRTLVRSKVQLPASTQPFRVVGAVSRKWNGLPKRVGGHTAVEHGETLIPGVPAGCVEQAAAACPRQARDEREAGFPGSHRAREIGELRQFTITSSNFVSHGFPSAAAKSHRAEREPAHQPSDPRS